MSTRPDPTIRLRGFDLGRAATNPLSDGFMQWCVVAPDLDVACAKIEALYGTAGFYVLENAPLNQVEYRGAPIDIRVDMALGYIGDTNIEVIAPREDGPDDLYREFLREKPEGGLHHLGFRVHDFERVSGELTRDYGLTVQEGRFGGGGTRFAYFDTRSVTGVFTEILWFDPSADRLMTDARRGDAAALLG